MALAESTVAEVLKLHIFHSLSAFPHEIFLPFHGDGRKDISTTDHLGSFKKYSGNSSRMSALLKQSGLQWAENPISISAEQKIRIF